MSSFIIYSEYRALESKLNPALNYSIVTRPDFNCSCSDVNDFIN